MSDLKTKPTEQSVDAFLDSLDDESKRAESHIVLEMMREITGAEPRMWGASIIGFGSYHFKYASGREGDWFLAGFAPRKRNLTLYIMAGFAEYDALLKQLGTYKTGKSCLYINKLTDVDQATLRRLVEESVAHMRATYE